MPKITVKINGTNSNPYNPISLTQNPFPQLAGQENDQAMLRVQALGGDPVPSEQYIRELLGGYCTDEFINLCVNEFKVGVMTEFDVSWNE